MLTLAQPVWLWLLLLIPAVIVVFPRAHTGLERTKWWSAVGLRCATLTAIILTLAEPQFVRRNDETTVIFAVDRSRSIPADLRQQAQEYVTQASRKARQGDRIGVVSFDGVAQIDRSVSPSRLETYPFSLPAEPDQTDISGALRLAMAMFPSDTTRRIVLLTDGNENAGSLLNEVEVAAAAGVAVDVVPLEHKAVNEIWVDRLIAPARVAPNSRIELRAVMRSRRTGRARITWYHNETMIPVTDADIRLSGPAQPDVVVLPMELQDAGVHQFEVRITPTEGTADTLVENNVAKAFTIVEGKSRLLIIDAADANDNRPLAEALASDELEVVHRTRDQVTIDPLALNQYGAVILGNLSADQFNEQEYKALASYVRDLGGGLILTGGDAAFGAGGWAGTPIEEISPVAFSFPPQKMSMPSALVIVLDRSGSMGSVVEQGPETQQQVANEAAILALRSLLPIDHVGLIAFDSKPHWVVPLQRNTRPALLASQIRAISPGGGTDIYPALVEAVDALGPLKGKSTLRHIILLSDGQTMPGPFDELAARMVRSGISISTIGVGNAMNDPVLSQLAKLGGGTYYPVTNARTLPRVFFRETRLFRERLICEESFVPQVVAATSPLLAGLYRSSFPPLQGLVRTLPKVDATVALERREKKDQGEPLLAHWYVGMGRVVAFTSGWWPHWGGEWVNWADFGPFWKQTVRWALSSRDADGFDVTTRLDGDEAHILVEALSDDVKFLNALDIRGVAVTPGYENEPIRLKQTGAGRYEATFTAREPGNYLVNLRAAGRGSSAGTIRTGFSVSYSPEYRELQTCTPLLDAAVRKSGGRLRTLASAESDDLFIRDLPPIRASRPVWPWMLAWLVMPLFLLDVAARRLASPLALSIYIEAVVLAMLIGCCQMTHASAAGYVLALIAAEAVGWSLRWALFKAALQYVLLPVTARAASGASPAETMARLQQSHQRLRDELDESQAEHGAGSIAEPARRPTATERETGQRRYTPKTPADGSSSTGPLIDADNAAPPRPSTTPDRAEEKSTPASLAGRLRHVKKRIHQQWENDDANRPGA